MRPEMIDQLLNPNNTLPPTLVEKNDSQKVHPSVTANFFNILNIAGERVGSIVLMCYEENWMWGEGEAYAQIKRIELEEQFRRLGYARASYVELLKYLGNTPLRSGTLAQEATMVNWEWLVEKGVARKTEGEGLHSKYETIFKV